MPVKDRFNEFKEAADLVQRRDTWNMPTPDQMHKYMPETADENGDMQSDDMAVDEAMHFVNNRRSVDVYSLVTERTGEDIEQFMHGIELLNNDLHLLEMYVEDLRMKHQLLMIDIRSDAQLKAETNAIVAAFTSLSVLQLELHDIEEFSKSRKQPDTALRRIRKVQTMGVEKRLFSVLSAFNEEQVDHRDRCKDRIKGYMTLTDSDLATACSQLWSLEDHEYANTSVNEEEPVKGEDIQLDDDGEQEEECAARASSTDFVVANQSVDEDRIEQAIEDNDINSLSKGFLTRDIHDAKRILEDVEARANDILELERSIRDLHNMFLDMALLIEQQGEMVDRIEHNIDITAEYVQNAADELRKARPLVDAYRKKRLICMLLVVVLIVLLVAFLLIGTCTYVFPCIKLFS